LKKFKFIIDSEEKFTSLEIFEVKLTNEQKEKIKTGENKAKVSF